MLNIPSSGAGADAFRTLDPKIQATLITLEQNLETYLNDGNIAQFNIEKQQLLNEVLENGLYQRHEKHPLKLTIRGPVLNLKGIDFEGCDLTPSIRGTDRSLNLCGTDLSLARLMNAELNTADLRDAYLFKADARSVSLRSACLDGANLLGANLEGADLRQAKFKGANLCGVKAKGALWSPNNYQDARCDLTFIRNLPDKHFDPIHLEMHIEGNFFQRVAGVAIILLNRVGRLNAPRA